MSYYFLSASSDLKIVGKFPQLEKMFEGFNMLRRYEAFGLHSENRTTPMERLYAFRLKYHAKLTDLISAAQFGGDCKLLSKNFYDLTCQYKIMNHIAIPSEVVCRNKQYAYQFIYFPDSYYQFVNYEKSRFYLKAGAGIYKGYISIKNYKQYQEQIAILDKNNEEAYQSGKPATYINVSELYLDEQAINLDLFRIARLFSNIIVSERLKNAIEQAGFTGIVFNRAQGFKQTVEDYSIFPPRVVE